MIEVSTEKRTENFCNNALRTLIQFSILFWLIPRSTEKILDSFLKSTKKGQKTASMRPLLQKFSVLFGVDTSINQKNIRIISYHLIFFGFQQRNQSFEYRMISKATFDVVEIHMTSQYSFSVDAKITSIFQTNQNKLYAITLIRICFMISAISTI